MTRWTARIAGILVLASSTFAQESRFGKEDVGLWKAAAVKNFYYNRTLVHPEPMATHIPLVDRLGKGPAGTRRTRLARTIATRYFIFAEYRPGKDQLRNAENALPKAWKKSMAGAMIRGLVGSEPSLSEPRFGDIRGGLVDSIDSLRENVTDLNRAQALLNFLDSAAASQIESHWRETSNGRKLPDEARLFIEDEMDDIGVRDPGPKGVKRYMPGTLARVSYAGRAPLENVVVVTRTTMKPPSTKELTGRALARGFNELFDNGEKNENGDTRAEAADKYIASEQLLAATPQAAIIYVPRLEPGDFLMLPLYGQGSYWNVLEAKVSVYSDSGAILDRVLLRAGPHNDLSIRGQDRPERPRMELGLPPGPEFVPVYSRNRLELTLDIGENQPASFDVCVPAGKTYVPIGKQETIKIHGPMIAIAKNDETYVAIGSPRSKGHCLVFVPAARVKKADLIDERTDSEKAFDAEAAAQIARNNARARGEQPTNAFARKAQQRPPQPLGGIFPRMTLPRGPGNRRNFPNRQNRSNAGKPPERPQAPPAEPAPAQPAGPAYKPFEEIVTLALPERTKDEEPYRFEACINAGDSYKPTGRQIEVRFDPRKPIRLIAEGPDHYVGRVTNARTKSIALVFIPRSIGGEIQKPE